MERLRAWRLATSKGREVPAYVVFTDLTLTALAERSRATRPHSWTSRASARPRSRHYGEALLGLVAQPRQ